MTLTPPPPLHTAVPGSFAHDTFRVRVPVILAGTRERLPHPLPPQVARALDELAADLAGRGPGVRPLTDDAPDRRFWDQAVAPHLGHGWLDLPWYFAEAYFYRRLLEATGYFGDGPLAGRDPFAAHKADEWRPEEGPRRLAEALAAAAAETGARDRARALLHASLWGNRADLSYNVARHLGAYTGDARADLLVDRTDQVLEFLATPRARLSMIGDNAGTELLMDLALADHLLETGAFQRIDLHLKTHPTFVSDALPDDVDAAQRALAAAAAGAGHDLAALAARLAEARATGRLVVSAHPFYTTSLFYRDLPADLRADYAAADLVLLKGDANYRRLCSDAPWPPETPFEEVVDYFPGRLVTLRTLKAETIVGLPPGVAAQLDAVDPQWMVNGRRGVIQTANLG
jgi:uncharacterized protein with ATP-grasp and redox domains